MIDDASQDDSPHIAHAFTKKHKNIFLIQHTSNRGPGAARNTGIEAARGSFLAFLDGDDLMHSTCLDRQMFFFLTHPETDVLYTALKVVDERGKEIAFLEGQKERRENFFPLMLFRNQIPGPGNIVAKKSVFLQNRYPEERKHGEDYALMLRLAEQGYCFSYFNEPLYGYRRHTHNLSNQIDQHQKSEEEILIDYPLCKLEAAVAASSFAQEDKILLLGKILWNQCHFEMAAQKFSSLVSEEAYFYLGNYWLKQQDPEKAISFFEKACVASSPNPAIFNNKGVALARLGREEEARVCFYKALSLSPTYLDAQRNLSLQESPPNMLAVTPRFLRSRPLPYR